MKESIGGIFNIQTVLIFIVLATGLLLFSVNYAKAFRVKNEFRRIIEQYEGLTESTAEKFDAAAKKYGYSFSNPTIYENACERNGLRAYKSDNYVFCYKCDLKDVDGTDVNNKTYKGAYYTIYTFVDIDIPLINKIFPAVASFLKIEGETSLIYSSGNNSEICQMN